MRAHAKKSFKFMIKGDSLRRLRTRYPLRLHRRPFTKPLSDRAAPSGNRLSESRAGRPRTTHDSLLLELRVLELGRPLLILLNLRKLD
jgi:hypothetical protein